MLIFCIALQKTVSPIWLPAKAADKHTSVSQRCAGWAPYYRIWSSWLTLISPVQMCNLSVTIEAWPRAQDTCGLERAAPACHGSNI